MRRRGVRRRALDPSRRPRSRRVARDELLLVFPTIKHLEQLAEFRSVDDALAEARGRKVQPVQPRVVERDGAPHVVLPGEPGYEE